MIQDGANSRKVRCRSVADFRLMDVSYPPGLTLAEHQDSGNYICVVASGYCDFRYRRRAFDLVPGRVFRQMAGVPHAGRFGPEGAEIFHLEVPSDLLSGAQGEPDLSGSRAGRAAGLAFQLRSAISAADDDVELESLSLELAGCLEDCAPRLQRRCSWLAAAVEVLREEYAEPISVQGLASRLDRHPCHVARVFRSETGMTVGRYLQRVRVAEAASLLSTDDDSISGIAYRCGFSDQSHMGRLFRRFLDMTPGQYRELYVGEGHIGAWQEGDGERQ